MTHLNKIVSITFQGSHRWIRPRIIKSDTFFVWYDRILFTFNRIYLIGVRPEKIHVYHDFSPLSSMMIDPFRKCSIIGGALLDARAPPFYGRCTMQVLNDALCCECISMAGSVLWHWILRIFVFLEWLVTDRLYYRNVLINCSG